jgi:hypothetical protein
MEKSNSCIYMRVSKVKWLTDLVEVVIYCWKLGNSLMNILTL